MINLMEDLQKRVQDVLPLHRTRSLRENSITSPSGSSDASRERIAEIGTANRGYFDPVHPYSKALISAIRNPIPRARTKERVVLQEIFQRLSTNQAAADSEHVARSTS
ncbi:MAG: hypothetical protein IPM83_11440 [Ignavibacteria bacterium]|nr:hypothetical protein [Ignavibacteria bacterium]